MSDGSTPLFLERRSYRQRRLMDAARLMPVLGAVMFAIPILWPRGADGAATSSAIVYIFGMWLMLAGLALMISINLDRDAGEDTGPPDGEGGA